MQRTTKQITMKEALPTKDNQHQNLILPHSYLSDFQKFNESNWRAKLECIYQEFVEKTDFQQWQQSIWKDQLYQYRGDTNIYCYFSDGQQGKEQALNNHKLKLEVTQQQKDAKDENKERNNLTLFTNNLLSLLRQRSPYITQQKIQAIRKDVNSFMKDHKLNHRHLKRIFLDVSSALKDYQIHFNSLQKDLDIGTFPNMVQQNIERQYVFLRSLFDSQRTGQAIAHNSESLLQYKNLFESSFNSFCLSQMNNVNVKQQYKQEDECCQNRISSPYIQDQERKNEENSSFYQSSNQKGEDKDLKIPKQTISVHKGIYQHLKDKILKEYQIVLALPISSESILAHCLRHIFNGEAFRHSLYNSALRYLAQMIKEKIDVFQQELTPHQIDYYIRIEEQYKKYQQLLQSSLEVNQQSDLQMDTLFRLDILSLFFQRYDEYLQYYQSYTQKKGTALRFPYKLLQTITSINQSYLVHLQQRFDYISQQVSNQYEEQFICLIDLFFLITLKQRIVNYERGALKPYVQNIKPISIEQMKSIVYWKNSHYKQSRFKFRFSELAYYPLGRVQKPKQLYIRLAQARKQINQILNLEDMQQKKSLFLKIILCHKISFDSLYLQYEKIKQGYDEKQKLINDLKVIVYPFQWLIIQKMTFNGILKFINITKFAQMPQKRSITNKIGLTCIFEIVMERYQLMAQAFRALKHIEKEISKRQLIYTCKFEYSFKAFEKKSPLDMSQLSTPCFQNQGQDLICSLIIATNESRVVFSVILFDKLENKCLQRVLQKTFIKFNKKSLNVVILEQRLSSGVQPLVRQEMMLFFKNLNSHLYIVNSPEDFIIHFAIDSAIRAILQSHTELTTKIFKKSIEFASSRIIKSMSTDQTS